MGTKSAIARALGYLRMHGPKRFAQRVRAVCTSYVNGTVSSFRGDCWLLPHLSMPSEPELPEVIYLGCIEWTYRVQRPQQMCMALAHLGCRVHYVLPASLRSRSQGWRLSNLEDMNRLWQVEFLSPQRTNIHELYTHTSSADIIAEELRRLVSELRSQGGAPVIIADHPYWERVLYGFTDATIIYDCIDDYTGFSHSPPQMKEREKSLASLADGLICTSQRLFNSWESLPVPKTLIRNACDYQHFSVKPDNTFNKPGGKPVLGYFGAIEDWFDIDLVEELALSFPECTLLLIGSAIPDAVKRLRRYSNVFLVGEIPNRELPRYVHAFDVALIPFRLQPLTLGVNPVKVYEYLAAGVPVVAVPLPELLPLKAFVRTGLGNAFIRAVAAELAAGKTVEAAEARKKFAANETWVARAHELLAFLRSITSCL